MTGQQSTVCSSLEQTPDNPLNLHHKLLDTNSQTTDNCYLHHNIRDERVTRGLQESGGQTKRTVNLSLFISKQTDVRLEFDVKGNRICISNDLSIFRVINFVANLSILSLLFQECVFGSLILSFPHFSSFQASLMPSHYFFIISFSIISYGSVSICFTT